MDWFDHNNDSQVDDYIIPEAFSSFFTDRIFRSGGTLGTDYDFDALESLIVGNTAYVDPTAAGGGDGSIGSPFNSLSTAIANTGFTIYRLKRGTRFKLTAGITPGREMAIMDYGDANDPKPQVTSAIDLTFAAHSSYANVYQATSPQTTLVIGSVFDETNLDANGEFIGLTVQSSPEGVRDNANSFYYDATTDIVYVRLFDNRAPDSSVACMLSSTTLRLIRLNASLSANTRFYIKNVDLFGANPFVLNNASTTFYWDFGAYNCRFSYAGNTNGAAIAGYSVGFIKDCRSDYNRGDGFNYSNSVGFTFEWDCSSWYNDRVASDSNNGSTSHLGWKIIRVGGNYQFSAGKGVQDINDTSTYSLGCTSINSTAINAAHKAGFATNSSTGTSESWWIECTGPTDSNKFWLFNNSTAHIYDGDLGNLLQGTNQQDAGGVLDELTESEVYA